MSLEVLHQIQAQCGWRGGLKGGRRRTKGDQERRIKAQSLRIKGYTQKNADIFQINQSTVARWLKS